MSRAVRKSSLISSGIPAISCIEPRRATSALRFGVSMPRSLAIFSKRGELSISLAPSRTFRTNATAKSGSMPEEVPAIMLMLPVGAIVVTVAFLIASHSRKEDSSKSGNEPRSPPRRHDSSRATLVMNPITSSAIPRASCEA